MIRTSWLKTIQKTLTHRTVGRSLRSGGWRNHKSFAVDVSRLETRTLLAATMPEASAPETVTGPAVELPAAETKVLLPNAPNSASFQAIGLQDQFNAFGTGSIPPDSMGAVGPNHFVEMINSSVAIYSKSGSLLSHVSLDSFFTNAGQGVTPANGTFDPRILYDQMSGRWFATAMETGVVAGKDNDIILAVSDTSDPTGSWKLYRIDVGITTGSDSFFTDYSTLGVDENGVYFGMTEFQDVGDNGSTDGSFAKIAVTPKASLIAGSPSLSTITQFSNITDMFSSPQPATNFADIAATDPFFFVSSSTTVFGNVNYRTVTWSGNTPTLSSTSAAATPAYANPINAPASGSTTAVNVGDDRLMMATVRNGHLWTTRGIGVNSSGTSSSADRTGVEWVDFNISSSTLSLSQSGRIFDNAASTPRFYYYPSLAVNGQGHMRIGFSGSNANEFVGAYSSGRLATDASGTTTAPTLIKAGEASYTRTDNSGRNRWGDYSFTSVDPTDDMTVWTLQEYAESNGTNAWGTWVSTIAAPTPTLNNPGASANQGASSVTLNLTGANFFDPGMAFPNHLDVQLQGGATNGITINSVTFNSATSATVNYSISAGASTGSRNIVLTNPDGQTVTVTNGLTINGAVNTAPALGGAVANQPVNDDATITPFATLTVTDPDTQAMSAIVQVTNGTIRGDLTAASTVGWSRSVVGNNFVYARTFSVGANIGATVQTAIRALVFQPRSNALTPPATETTSFSVTVTDGVATPVTNSSTTVVATSVNDAPVIASLNPNQFADDNLAINPFALTTLIDPDNQNMFARVTIFNGVVRGDFTVASRTGWTRSVVGNNIVYERFYNPTPNVGDTVQAALQTLVFQPRTDAIKPGTSELTDITLFVNDGTANASATTRLQTFSINDNPLIDGASPNVAVNDNATVNPFSTLTVSDPDNQDKLAKITVLNGVARGDFTNAVSSGWTRSVLGNNISYVRFFGATANSGAAVQAAYRALIFQPRANAIKPGTTEATDFLVSVSDGVASPVSDSNTRVTTTSVNNAPFVGGAVAGQTINDNQTKAVFSTLTVTDVDTQDLLATVRITNGTNRGDFTAGTSAGWTRTTSGSDIVYSRYFALTTNVGAAAQAAIRALVFQPRTNVPIGTSETTTFTVTAKDGSNASATNSSTTVITTGVAPRVGLTAILESDITTLVLPTVEKPSTSPLNRLVKKAR